MYADFDTTRVISAAAESSPVEGPRGGGGWGEILKMRGEGDESPASPGDGYATNRASIGGASAASGHLPRNESFTNLGNFGFFASRPVTPTSPGFPHHSRSHSRHTSGGFQLKGLTTLDSKGAVDDVTRRIRGAMRERGRRRASNGTEGGESDIDGQSHGSSDVDGEGTQGMTLKKES